MSSFSSGVIGDSHVNAGAERRGPKSRIIYTETCRKSPTNTKTTRNNLHKTKPRRSAFLFAPNNSHHIQVRHLG